MKKEIVRSILLESSIFETISNFQLVIDSCADKCQRFIRNGPDYPHQVSVCACKCKIRAIRKLLSALVSMRGSGVPQKPLQTKILYFQTKLKKEEQRLIRAMATLRKREDTIPVDLSLKPSPERYDPKKIG